MNRDKTVSFVHKGRSYTLAFPVEGDHICKMIRRRGAFYEADLLARIASLRLRGTYVDVGAHVGNHAIFFATQCRADAVLAAESSPRNLRCLRANIAANLRETEGIETIPHAVGREGEEYMVAEQENQNSGMDLTLWGAGQAAISVDALDRVFGPVSFVKIDTEGSEVCVLEGMAQTLPRRRPVLAIEAIGRRDLERQTAVLVPLGYKKEGPYASTPVYIWRPT